jgi:hypothetical protein
MCLTAHYIDPEWKLQKKIINFCVVLNPHTGDIIEHNIDACLFSWEIDKLCTLTVDNASANDVTVRNLIKKYNKKNGMLLDGEVFHIRCCTHILNLIVKDGLSEVDDCMNALETMLNM